MRQLRMVATVAAAMATATSLAACGSGGGSSSPGTSGGKPTMGGTLTMLGVGDLDHVDSGAWYYTTDYELGNLIARNLVTYPRDVAKGIMGTTPVGDAADLPTVSKDGKTYTFKIKPGVKWDTQPARQVTASDFIRGLARMCNPVAPFGATTYFFGIIGFKTFCNNELSIDPSAAALQNYLKAHLKDVTGMKASNHDTTLTFTLDKPDNTFVNVLALGVDSAVPVEYLKYAPDSAALGQHLISDGPYRIDSYKRAKSINLSRNPAWQRSTDANRPAYVDKIDITENLTQPAVQQQIKAGSADMEWDTFVPPADVARLNKLGDPNLKINSTSSSNPYVVFNTVSPAEGGALGKAEVRRAISTAINKADIIQVLGGPVINNPLNQVLPTVINGGEQQFNPYPFDAAKAKQQLASAGYPKGLTLKLLYRSASEGSTKAAQTLQDELPSAGIHVKLIGVSNQDFYSKYLQVQPSVTKRGLWDLAIAGWGADWDGNSARSFFYPLFDGRVFAPSSSNFGDFNDPKVNTLMDKALAAGSVKDAAAIWHQADQLVMTDAPFVPLTNPRTANYYDSKRVHGFVYWDNFQNGDPTNVWLSK